MKTKILVATLLTTGAMTSAMAAAPKDATIAVTASIAQTCQARSNGTIAFVLDPTVTADATATGTGAKFWCTKGAVYTVTDGGGLHDASGSKQMQGTGAGGLAGASDFVKYSLSYTGLTGTAAGKSTDITVGVSGTVLNADYVNQTSGNYADTVTLTIAP